MVDPEAAQRGVLQAILDLYNRGTFTAPLDDFYKSVRPRYSALYSLIAEAAVADGQRQPNQTRYGQYTNDWSRLQREFEDALQAWARQFRLTHNLTKTGEALPWVLDFGRRACESGSFTIPHGPGGGKRMQPPWGSIPAPGPNEKLPEWFARIRPLALALRREARKQQRSRPYPDSAKRNQNHYRWFVLNVCGGLAPGKILEALKLLDSDESTIRKGTTSVREALGLTRK